ncbi:hypothetical protein ACO1O0_006850 [Amphichorda felina]
MGHRSSLAASEATYHSFNDIELFEPPASPPRKTARPVTREITDMSTPSSEDMRHHSYPAAIHMKRQDSGYESYGGTPRSSISQPRPSPPPRRGTGASTNTTNTNTGTPSPRPRTRPSTRRSAKSYNSSAVHIVRTQLPPQTIEPSSYFHFPSPDPADDMHHHNHNYSSPYHEHSGMGPYHHHHHHHHHHDADTDLPLQTLPPQTTHYWTSDRTRRLEYAAIDAASRGLKGWIRRHLLPDCLAARDGGRHIPFDDDSGSVRRYRLELEEDDAQHHHHHSHSHSHHHRRQAAAADEKAAAAGGRRRPAWSYWIIGGGRRR